MDNRSAIARHGRIRACESCNRRKKRCDGQKPQCYLCIQSGTVCIYPRLSLKPGPKKGTKPGGQCVKGSGEARGAIITPTNTSNAMEWDMTGEERWALSSSSLEQSPALWRMTSSISPSLSAVRSFQPESVLPSRELIYHLVDLFFDFVQPQFRLLHRPSFVSWVHSESFLSCKNSTLVLTAMFALSAKYSDDPRVDVFDASLCPNSDCDKSRRGFCYKGRKRWERGTGFINRARQHINTEISMIEQIEITSGRVTKPPISLIQACALLSFAELGAGLNNRAYSLISTCVRMTYDYGLHEIDLKNSGEPIETRAGLISKTPWIQKEELRRAWWCIWDLETFASTAKLRPPMMNSRRCKTKLPCDDKDWFEGRECSSDFLPVNLHSLRTFLDVLPNTSVLSRRILACHLGAALIDLVDVHNVADSNESILIIEDCASVWKHTIPGELRPESQPLQILEQPNILSDILPMHINMEHISVIMGKVRMFSGATPTTIFNYCQDISKERSNISRNEGNAVNSSSGAQAFFDALRASDAICAIVRDWPTDSIVRTCPFIVYALWLPACVQLLVKSFAESAWELAEKATLSLRILTMTMEQFAEHWGLGRLVLASFRRYERILANGDRLDEESISEDHLCAGRVISFPPHINGSFMKELSSLCTTNQPADWPCEGELLPQLDLGSESMQLPHACDPLPWSLEFPEYQSDRSGWLEADLSGFDFTTI